MSGATRCIKSPSGQSENLGIDEATLAVLVIKTTLSSYFAGRLGKTANGCGFACTVSESRRAATVVLTFRVRSFHLAKAKCPRFVDRH